MNWIWSPNYVQNHFLDKRKNGCFSVILARTSFIVIFLMARTVPPSFVDDGPKLRVFIIAKLEQPKNGMSPEKWPIAWKRIFFWGRSEWETWSPGCTGYMPCWQKSIFQNKKNPFWPQIPKFLGQNCTFLSLAASWGLTGQCFQHERGVSLVPWYEGTKSFTPSPQKWIFGPKTNLDLNWNFWPIIGIFGPFDLIADRKTLGTSFLGGFPICGY